jgi:N-acetylglutamate synthase-like GNAT family acetyltransferase
MTVRLRPAAAADQPVIKALIHAVRINPMGLNWERFIVADDEGRFVGCAQIKPHNDGARELASLAVIPECQGQGIGSLLVRAMLERERGELYLACRSSLTTYYERFGFQVVPPGELPGSFKLQYRFGRLLARLSIFEGPCIMRRSAAAARA